MKINDLWLVKDCEGYWRTGYSIDSSRFDSVFYNPYMPSIFTTVLLSKFFSGKVCCSYSDVDERTAVRYEDLGNITKSNTQTFEHKGLKLVQSLLGNHYVVYNEEGHIESLGLYDKRFDQKLAEKEIERVIKNRSKLRIEDFLG